MIILSARSEVTDQMNGFEKGADDYITKPFSLGLVKLHIEAVLKRAGKMKNILADPIINDAIQNVKITECFSPKMAPFLLLKMKQYRLASQIYAFRARQNWKRENPEL